MVLVASSVVGETPDVVPSEGNIILVVMPSVISPNVVGDNFDVNCEELLAWYSAIVSWVDGGVDGSVFLGVILGVTRDVTILSSGALVTYVVVSWMVGETPDTTPSEVKSLMLGVSVSSMIVGVLLTYIGVVSLLVGETPDICCSVVEWIKKSVCSVFISPTETLLLNTCVVSSIIGVTPDISSSVVETVANVVGSVLRKSIGGILVFASYVEGCEVTYFIIWGSNKVFLGCFLANR